MRDLIRLLLVAVMSFAVVGVAMVYSRGGDFDTAISAVSQGVSSVVASAGQLAGAPAEAGPEAPRYTLSLQRPNAGQWVGLAGFPDQTEVSFPLPRGAHYLSGALELVLDTQLTVAGDGLLTVSVNGTPRGQVVLDKGEATHKVRIALQPVDLLGDRVVLNLSGRGTTNSGQICPSDAANSGSAVTLAAESRLELTSDTPMTDAIATLALAPQPLVIAPGSADSDMGLAIWASQRLGRAGFATRLGEAGSGETAIKVSDHAAAVAGVSADNVLVGPGAVEQLIGSYGTSLVPPAAWPVSVADLGADTLVKTFRNARRWTIGFAIADLPEGKLPEALQLQLKTTPLSAGNDWVVRISLNGNLVDSERLPGGQDSIAVTAPLPAQRLLPRNSLVVELVDTTPNQGICTRAPDAQAQLLPESALVARSDAPQAWAQLIGRLAASPSVAIDAEAGLSLDQASRGSALLGLVLPAGAKPVFGSATAPARLTVTDRAHLAQRLGAVPADGKLTAILPGVAGTGIEALAVPSAALGAALERLGADDVLILVSGL